MDIYIHGLPKQATNTQVNDLINRHLFHYGIHEFQCFKPKNKGFAHLHIKDLVQGTKFLDVYQKRTDVKLPGHRYPLAFKLSYQQDGGAQLRDERFREMVVEIRDVPFPPTQDSLVGSFSGIQKKPTWCGNLI